MISVLLWAVRQVIICELFDELSFECRVFKIHINYYRRVVNYKTIDKHIIFLLIQLLISNIISFHFNTLRPSFWQIFKATQKSKYWEKSSKYVAVWSMVLFDVNVFPLSDLLRLFNRIKYAAMAKCDEYSGCGNSTNFNLTFTFAETAQVSLDWKALYYCPYIFLYFLTQTVQ